MDSPAALSLIVPLPRPVRGGAARVRVGGSELVLEHARGCHSLLWSDGREARRYVLGLDARGRLTLELRAPRLPLRVVPREAWEIVPAARLRGYLTAPLVPPIVWRAGGGTPKTLVELHPRGLAGAFHERDGHAFRCAVTWLSRFPVRTGEPQVVVPLRLYNRTRAPICPGELAIELDDAHLVPLRGAIVVRPQRIALADDAANAPTAPDPLAMGEA